MSELATPVVESERTLVSMLVARARQATSPAARVKRGGHWHDVSWTDVVRRVRELSNALVAYGIQPGDRVALFAGTSLDWCVADLAIAAARAASVPIYSSNTPAEIRYLLNDSQSRLLLVDHDVTDLRQAGRVARAREIIAETKCERVIIFDGQGLELGPREQSLEQFIALSQGPDDFDARVDAVQPSDLYHLLYTSGTTGDPKGVMLTHGNWAFQAQCIRRVKVIAPTDSVMLFLPLAHSFAQVVKASWLSFGFTLIFAESVDKLVANVTETSPTVLPAVPRVFEKIYANVSSTAMSAPGVKGALARWAFEQFDEYAAAREKGSTRETLSWLLAKRLVFAKVRETLMARLGGRLRIFVSGGAPLSPKIAFFFDALGFLVCEGYGLTETSATATVNWPERIKIGTVGQILPGVELNVADDGELLVRGPIVMQGYWGNQAATSEVLEASGWFHTGDIGVVDSDGFVRITDRKKDLIKTSGGKYCAPQNLENVLKTHPLISQAMVVGDQRPYLTALICLNEEHARAMLAEFGVQGADALTLEALAQRADVRAGVQRAIDALNADQPPYNTIKRFAFAPHEFSQQSGELTPTLKVKRRFCVQKFAVQLEALYAAE